MMAHTRLNDPEYKNWVTVGRAIQITKKGIEALIQNAVDKYHTSLLATLPNSIHAWKTQLTKAHRSTDKRKISWNNSDCTQWLIVGASWEIAKIFMAPLGPRKLDVLNAQTSDISGLLNVLEWSPRGTNGIFNTGVCPSKIAKARSARNLWAHERLLRISDGEKAEAFASLTSLLQDAELNGDKDSQDAINKLSNLLSTSLTDDAEFESLVRLGSDLGQDIVNFTSDMVSWKEDVEATLGQILDQTKSFEEFVRKNELQDVLDVVQKRFNDLEDKIVSQLGKPDNDSKQPEPLFCDGKPELEFNPVCDGMKEEFVGREWLFGGIDNWLGKDLEPRESRAFLIWGGPGTGKSSFAQELVRRHEKLNTLAGYHYCQKDNPRTCDLESLVYSLNSMFSKRLPQYPALVAGQLNTADKFREHPDKLFDLLITTPLEQLKAENTKRVLVIDGLDEGGPKIASCLAKLSEKLPSWLRVILTTRHTAPALTNLFPNSTSANLDHLATLEAPSANHCNNDEDIRKFVCMKYERLLSEHKDTPPFFVESEEEGKEKIVRASQNCFLYAKLVMEHIFAGHDAIGLPPSLSEIYCLDFRRHFPDIELFEKKVVPVLEIVLAINSADAFLYKHTFIERKLAASIPDISEWARFAFLLQTERYEESNDECVARAAKCGLLPGIEMRDLMKALELLSDYLTKDFSGKYYFSHSSVRDWLQDEESDFFCDVSKGNHVMATYNLQTIKDKLPSVRTLDSDLYCALYRYCYSNTLQDLQLFFLRYLFHSSDTLESGSSNVNDLISELGVEAIDLLHVAFKRQENHLPIIVRSEYLAMRVLEETDVLNKMSSKEKAEHLELAIRSNCARVVAKFIDSAYWIFSQEVIYAMTKSEALEEILQFVQKKESMPQLFFSFMCPGVTLPPFFSAFFYEIVGFCLERGLTADVCLPAFSQNTYSYDSSTCWNEDVQEYFRKLKSGEKNVITLESLKEEPFYPEEAKLRKFTLEIIQKPLSEIERLLRNGEIYVSFTYAWHVPLLIKTDLPCIEMVDYFLDHGANPNNRGGPGMTALMLACSNQDVHVVSLLLEYGASVYQQSFHKLTAFHQALAANLEPTQNTLALTQLIIQILLHHIEDN